jgi:hypothetical protein
MKKLLLIFIAVFSYALTTDNTFRLSYQNLKFQNEHLGLLETSYLINFKPFYIGAGVYSAVTGKRGGFFVGGINIGVKIPILKSFLDTGIFLGGGGGGHAPQGSGLMGKIYAGVMLPYKQYNLGFQINRIKFKDGSIDSTQIAAVIDYNFKDVFFLSPKTIKGFYDIKTISFNPYINRYIPINSKTTTGQKQKSFWVMGAEIEKQNENYFTFINAGGAFKGESDGYAEFLFGIGKKIKSFILKASIGAAGGGEVDTKGGFVYKLEAQKNINPLFISTGFFNAPGGIKAYFIKGGVFKKFDIITTGNRYVIYKPKKYLIRLYSESYLPSDTIRTNHISKRLDVLNLKIGFYKKNILYFATAGGAYNGLSGGYAIGTIGMEYDFKHLFISGAFGAAGGGSVDVGGGFVVKGDVGIKYKHLFLSIGRIKAIEGGLNTTTLSFGININFYK